VIDPDQEAHIMAMAQALFDHEPRNNGKRFADVSTETRYRYTDKAAWCLSQTAETIRLTAERKG
jgi:hypothetical protein